MQSPARREAKHWESRGTTSLWQGVQGDSVPLAFPLVFFFADLGGHLLQKIDAGFLGMNIGIRLGAPVEPEFWSYEKIRDVYGDIRGYVKDFKHFAADDDANGPVLFLRALNDTDGREPTPEAVAEAWLNYAREGVGLYWWGGFGVSTEHTAYLNLKNGIPAPQSGSIAQNGVILAEQIGAQIFIDTWGLICPGDPVRAARYARAAASVAHDGEGLHGAAFMAACIARAFDAASIGEIIDAGLAQIPAESTYARVVRAVLDFHRETPDDWRACMAMLKRDWGYDKYRGVCHIIPNAGVCALAMAYGAGDFARTIEIATMCSWDTDCNAGNVGTVLGVFAGLAGLPAHYRDPINDEIVLSGISGYLNILDIPTYAKTLQAWAERLAGRDAAFPPEGEVSFDFVLPGSTHGLQMIGGNFASFARAKDVPGVEVRLNRASRGQGVRVFYKPFFRRADFDDERYMPVFSPTAYPGQTVEITARYERESGETVVITPYVRESLTGRIVPLGGRVVEEMPETQLRFTVPEVVSGLVDEVGLLIESNSPPKFIAAGRLVITGFRICGKGSYTIEMAKTVREFGSIMPFSHNHGAWSLENGRAHVLCEAQAEAFTGNYFMRDARATLDVCPENGDSHLVSLRVQGARRGYYAGFDGAGRAAILRRIKGRMERLAAAPFAWETGHAYTLAFTAQGDTLSLSIDGTPVLSATDDTLRYGMAGFAMDRMGRATLGNMTIEEL